MSNEIKESELRAVTAEELAATAVDHEAIEAQLINEAQKASHDPGEMAASMYAMQVPEYKKLVSKMSVRAMRRVMDYLILYPLEKNLGQPSTPDEARFMQVTQALAECKFIMIMDSYAAHAKQLQEGADAPLTTEQQDAIISDLRKAGVSEEEINKMVQAQQENI